MWQVMKFFSIAGIELSVANQKRVKKLHIMIWISKVVLNETPMTSLFDNFFYPKTYSCVWLLPFTTEIWARIW